VNTLAPHPASTARATLLARALVILALLGGCAAPAPRSGAGGSPPAAPFGSEPATTLPRPAPSPLVTEQRWLDELFRGTPVVIAMPDGDTLTVDVPLANSFAAGSSSIKPALAAVLDRVASSLRRQTAARVSLAVPTDVDGTAALGATRARQVREYLGARGVATTRMTGTGAARAGSAVQLRMMIAPAAIGRLDDATLPVPTLGVKPAAATPASGVKR
jgi:outer membrane protein OmpA-like peptidoglycan-associated protein